MSRPKLNSPAAYSGRIKCPGRLVNRQLNRLAAYRRCPAGLFNSELNSLGGQRLQKETSYRSLLQTEPRRFAAPLLGARFARAARRLLLASLLLTPGNAVAVPSSAPNIAQEGALPHVPAPALQDPKGPRAYNRGIALSALWN